MARILHSNRAAHWILLAATLALLCTPAHAARISGQDPQTGAAQAQGRGLTAGQQQAPPQEAAKANGQVGQAGPAQKPEQPKEPTVSINFTDVDIDQVIAWVAKTTGKNFVIDQRVRGKVTVISNRRIPVSEVYPVFLSILEVYGFTAIESGELTKVLPMPEVRDKSVQTRTKPRGKPGDRVVTQIIGLEYANTQEISALFKPMVSRTGLIQSYGPTNSLIVTDVESNIQRLLNILGVIDVPGVGQEISVIPLEYASAQEMVNILSNLFARQRAPSARFAQEPIRMVADERTNTLILLASKDDTAAVKGLVAMLDRQVPRGEGKIRVFYLQNATAEDVAAVLENIVARKGAPVAGQKPAEAPLISRDVQISADKATNSLIITANKEDYAILEEVIKKLDIPRAMVYIEALIVEVSTDKNFDLGVEWRAGDDFTVEGSKAGWFAGSGGAGSQGAYSIFPSPTVIGNQVALNYPTAFSVGVVGEAIRIGDVLFPNIGAVMRAFQKDSDVHILSAPQLLTTNNEEAEITVGRNVPYVVRQETSAANVDYSTFEYRDVGVILKITPQISQERLVRLSVYQEVTRLIQAAGTTTQPTTFKRTTDTTVIVKDGNTIVIGGLIDESTEGNIYQVPCLGNIPLLGWFFKSVSETRQKTNLYVFLTPHIIENPEEAGRIFADKREEIQQMEEGTIKMYKRRGGISIPFKASEDAFKDTPPGPATTPREVNLLEEPEQAPLAPPTAPVPSKPPSSPYHGPNTGGQQQDQQGQPPQE
ncbi:MAG: type II secretion system secretin GspD [Deltaproteobacteria bacterium]|nr:type II secretion system secretin GspD [Deltaproteobacteria bacterium]